jgi:hypothetical protein
MTDIETIQEVIKQSKGWPVGIPTDEEMAKELVNKGYARWAPPAYTYSKPVFAISITSKGKIYAGV